MASLALKGFRGIVKVPMRWGDMDAFQHLNNVVFYRYAEQARITAFEEIASNLPWGDEFLDPVKKGSGPIVSRTACQFKCPVVYPDTLTIGTRVMDLKKDRFLFAHRMVNLKGVVCAEAEGEVVWFNYKEKRKMDMDQDLYDALAQWHQESLEAVKVERLERA